LPAILRPQALSRRRWPKESSSQSQRTARDWLVENDGNTYTVAADSFVTTYQQISPGRYIKIAPVWAEIATHDGAIKTREGESYYGVGDYLVYNRENRKDGYTMAADVFEKMYEPVSDP
jgi:hypothetical protein